MLLLFNIVISDEELCDRAEISFPFNIHLSFLKIKGLYFVDSKMDDGLAFAILNRRNNNNNTPLTEHEKIYKNKTEY